MLFIVAHRYRHASRDFPHQTLTRLGYQCLELDNKTAPGHGLTLIQDALELLQEASCSGRTTRCNKLAQQHLRSTWFCFDVLIYGPVFIAIYQSFVKSFYIYTMKFFLLSNLLLQLLDLTNLIVKLLLHIFIFLICVFFLFFN